MGFKVVEGWHISLVPTLLKKVSQLAQSVFSHLELASEGLVPLASLVEERVNTLIPGKKIGVADLLLCLRVEPGRNNLEAHYGKGLFISHVRYLLWGDTEPNSLIAGQPPMRVMIKR